MHKATWLIVGGLALLVGGWLLLSGLNSAPSADADQRVWQETLTLSRTYTLLHLQTDTVLRTAETYPSYEAWRSDLDAVLAGWAALEQSANTLEQLATTMATEDTFGWQFAVSAHAYDRQEISRIFDRAPAGKKIATLAKHLGVDAKRAYAILTQDQAQVQADAWNEAGDTFKKLEATAVAIKDVSKVTTFVGSIVVSGGTSALAAGSTLTKAAVVVAGADLTLEVTDDAAKIALGDKNKLSSVVGSARVVTEPAAAVLMIANLPSQVTSAADVLSVTTFGAEQLNSGVQEGKVVGISLPTAVKPTPPPADTMTVSVLEPAEVTEWLEDEALTETELSTPEIEEWLEALIAQSPVPEPVPTIDTAVTPTNRAPQGAAPVGNSGDKLVLIEFINGTNGTWIIDRTTYGSDEYRTELDAMDANDFAVGGGQQFMSINRSAADVARGSSNFSETSPTTYEYGIQLIAGGTYPEDEDEQYVYAPFAAVQDMVVRGTYGETAIIEWNGSTFIQVK